MSCGNTLEENRSFRRSVCHRDRRSAVSLKQGNSFPLERQVLDGLHSVVMNPHCAGATAWTYMLLWSGFNEDFHKSISMNNFFYNYIFNI